MTHEAVILTIGGLAVAAFICLALGIMSGKEWPFRVGMGFALLGAGLAFGGVLGLYQDPEPVQLACKLIDGDYYCKA